MIRNAIHCTFQSNLTIADVELAIALNEFYFLNFQVILNGTKEQKEVLPSVESIINMAKQNGAIQKAVVEITGSNKGTFSKKWNKS
jgi:hypothetical protein